MGAFEEIEKTDGRIVITNIVQSLFTEVIKKYPQDLLALLYLLSNRVAPEFEGKELGIGIFNGLFIFYYRTCTYIVNRSSPLWYRISYKLNHDTAF